MTRGRWMPVCALVCLCALAMPVAARAATGAPPPAGSGGPQSVSTGPTGKTPVESALPAVAPHPKSAASLAESRRLAADAARTENAAERVALLRRALAVEPANHEPG